MSMKSKIKAITPEWLILAYHYVIARLADLRYGRPSRKMIIIGVTGTKGKTSTANFLWSVLHADGIRAGLITTANVKIADREMLNTYHMTMPGRAAIQKLMADMVRAGCTHCIVETTSEGLKQFRHIGIRYDIGIFTNLTPEHLRSHDGSFEKYKEMKGRMFRALGKSKKRIAGHVATSLIVANADDEHVGYFTHFPASSVITYGITPAADVQATNITHSRTSVEFSVGDNHFSLGILGAFNVLNALPSIIVAQRLGVTDDAIAKGLKELTMIPGRMEVIHGGQSFTVIIDYAHEKISMRNALSVARELAGSTHRVISIVGAEGGGRDTDKRTHIGEIAAELSDVVIVSNVDPYDDNPDAIITDVISAARSKGKRLNSNCFAIADRRLGIRKALSSAKKGDVVIITGKGAEQSMIIRSKRIPWDDRTVVREELKRLK